MNAITLQGVSKKFVKYEDTPSIVGNALQLWRRNKRSVLWAVRDLDVEIKAGESVGLIGRNGSGKSTTLQMLCGVTAPSTGTVTVRGRIAPLISVGVGFHPELTGRENVYINGAILGMSRAEIDRKFDAIVAFSGVEEFMDTPVKFYSSGMAVRLGFSVAAHSDPQVLLVDEVLAVGDLSFTVKCFDHMTGLQRQGTTIVVVSHNLAAIERLCPRTLVMNKGRAVFDGATVDGIAAYHEALAEQGEDGTGAGTPITHERDVVEVQDVHLVDESGRRSARISGGEKFRARVTLTSRELVRHPYVVVSVTSPDGLSVYREHNLRAPYPDLQPGETATWDVEMVARLPTGSYGLAVAIGRSGAAAVTDDVRERLDDLTVIAAPPALRFYVSARPAVHGLADLEGRFLLSDGDGAG